jgi:hypothetical protein
MYKRVWLSLQPKLKLGPKEKKRRKRYGRENKLSKADTNREEMKRCHKTQDTNKNYLSKKRQHNHVFVSVCPGGNLAEQDLDPTQGSQDNGLLEKGGIDLFQIDLRPMLQRFETQIHVARIDRKL